MILAIIQARMNSSRLPNKMLSDIGGKPMLSHVINRTVKSKMIDKVSVATTTDISDDLIEDFCVTNEIHFYRGSEDDVLDRFYNLAKLQKADHIVRITGDCPFVDPEIIDEVITVYKDGNYDYVTNSMRYTYPDGLDVEVFSYQALQKAWENAKSLREREHVVSYFKYSGLFKIKNVINPNPVKHEHRWSVDQPIDLKFVREVYSQFVTKGNLDFRMNDILTLLSENPHILDINSNIDRNQGSYTSYANDPPIPPLDRSVSISYEIKEKAEKLIPGLTQTFSKGPLLFIQDVAPVYLTKAEGSHTWDVDGNEYIDYPMALGPVILGHNYPAVTQAVIDQIQNGTSYSLAHPLEVEVADLIVNHVPSAEMVRFGKNGSDATSGAVRAARAYTGRDVIACCGYHGWQDWYVGTTTRDGGVPESVKDMTITFEYNNIDSLKDIFDKYPNKVAAVIMEPIGLELPNNNFLEQVKNLTKKEDAVLIYDEVVTGFRLSLGGAQDYFGVTPDLTCVGKAMGNGYPISAIAGNKDIMSVFDEIFFSFTFGGEAVSLAAAKATIKEMENKPVIDHLWQNGQRLSDGFNALSRHFELQKYLKSDGLAPHTAIAYMSGDNHIDPLIIKSLFQQECIKRGILISSSQNISFSHTNQDIDYTLKVYRSAMEILATSLKEGNIEELLEGPPVKPVFRNP